MLGIARMLDIARMRIDSALIVGPLVAFGWDGGLLPPPGLPGNPGLVQDRCVLAWPYIDKIKHMKDFVKILFSVLSHCNLRFRLVRPRLFGQLGASLASLTSLAL